MMLPLLYLFATLAAASTSLCPYNRFNQYYIVYGPPNPDKVDQAGQQLNGVPFEMYSAACEMHGLRVANITAAIVPDLISMLYECQPSVPLKQVEPPPIPAVWFNSYEGLPSYEPCNVLIYDGTIGSSVYICGGFSLLALCEAQVAFETVPSTVTDSATVTEDVTSILTTVILSTETVTDYFVTRITTVITEGTTLTTITTTSTSCSTIIHTVTSSCCHGHHHHHPHCYPCRTQVPSCPYYSSSSCNCCPHNHHHRRDHYHHGCHNCGAKMQEDVSDWKSTKLVKVPASPNNAQQDYVQCTSSLNDYYLVHIADLGGKAMRAANINGIEACEFFEHQLANITIPLLSNLASLFSDCLLPYDNFVFNSYYAWTPLCGFVDYGPEGGVGLNDVSASICDETEWALCKAGPAVVSTSTLSTGTGTFSTETVTDTTTETEVMTETISTTVTSTENASTTVTSTSYYWITSTTSTTVPTTTVTLTSTSITSCCCNPVVCTTIQECCHHR